MYLSKLRLRNETHRLPSQSKRNVYRYYRLPFGVAYFVTTDQVET